MIYREVHQVNLNHALIAAVKRSNVEQVVALLNAGADPNTRDAPPESRNAWHVLIDLLHNRHSSTSGSPTALIVALDQRKGTNEWLPQTPEIVRLLLSRGADVNAVVRNSSTPLQLAFECRPLPTANDMLIMPTENIELVSILLISGARTEAYGHYGECPLMSASESGFKESAELLIRFGADVNAIAPGSIPDSALSAAKLMGHKDIVKLLLAHGAKR